jgi:hypothetical protein
MIASTPRPPMASACSHARKGFISAHACGAWHRVHLQSGRAGLHH